MEINVVKEKLKKLLALSGSPNEAEAALAMSKCRELMEKYGIRTIDIDNITGKVDVVVEIIEGINGRHETWESKLGASIANAFDAIAVITRKRKSWEIAFIAAKTDAEFIVYLYKRLRRIISVQGNAYAKTRTGNKRTIKHSYRLGMVLDIQERLFQIYGTFSDSRALVVVKKDAVKEKIQETFGKIQKTGNVQVTDELAFITGQIDASKISLNKALESQESNQ